MNTNGTYRSPEIGTPDIPSAGTKRFYAKSDGWYSLHSSGTETKIDNAISGTTTGTDTYAITISNHPLIYSSDLLLFIKFTNANTGASTLNINSIGAISIKKNVSDALISGDIKAGQILLLVFDGTNFQLAGDDDSAIWGNITGTLSNQTDLQTALDTKLVKTNNLSDVDNVVTARTNLSVASKVEIQNSSEVTGLAVGTDTYTISLIPTLTIYTTGQTFFIKFTNANTGAATLNVDSLGAIAIKKNVSTALVANDILAGQIIPLHYDGTNFQITGGGSVVDASDIVKGITKLSVAPILATNPIAVGDNDDFYQMAIIASKRFLSGN